MVSYGYGGRRVLTGNYTRAKRVADSGDITADITAALAYVGKDGDWVILDATGAAYRYSTTAGMIVRPEVYAWATLVLSGQLDGSLDPSAESPAWANTDTGGTLLADIYGRVTLDSFVASTSAHTITVNGTAYTENPAGADEETTLTSFKTAIEAGEAGSTVTVRGTGATARAYIGGVTTLAAGTNTSLGQYDASPWVVFNGPAATCFSTLTLSTDPTEVYVSGWLEFQAYVDAVTPNVWCGGQCSQTPNSSNYELTGGSRASDVTVTVKRFVEIYVAAGASAPGDSGGLMWVDGALVSFDSALSTASGTEKVVIGDNTASENELWVRTLKVVQNT